MIRFILLAGLLAFVATIIITGFSWFNEMYFKFYKKLVEKKKEHNDKKYFKKIKKLR